MRFSIVFPSHESSDIVVSALFTPCLTWHCGGKMVLNPHTHLPNYMTGDLRVMMDELQLLGKFGDYTNKVTLVAHSNGHGTQNDLNRLQKDLMDAGFDVLIVHQ